MANEKTRADAIRYFLTGASTHEGVQAIPDLSIGNHKSSSEMVSLDISVSSPIANITVDFAAGSNGVGAGTLTATGTDTVKWTPPGGTQGADVTILNGQTKIVEDLNDAKKFVRITRTSATALTGAATVTLSNTLNNPLGFDNVSTAEKTAGDTEFRCMCIENVSASAVSDIKAYIDYIGSSQTSDTAQLPATGAGTIGTSGSFADWPATGWVLIGADDDVDREMAYYASRTDTVLTVTADGRAALGVNLRTGGAGDTVRAIPGIGVAFDPPASQPSGATDTIADEDTVPPTPVFDFTHEAAFTSLTLSSLAPGEIQFLWIVRVIPPNAVSDNSLINNIVTLFDAS